MALAKSTILSKILVAITGLIMYGFVIGHLLGNLLVYKGPAAINEYGQFLVDLGGGLWITRIVLLGAVILHIALTLSLTSRNKEARKNDYKKYVPKKSTVSSRWMATAGITILLFIILHLLHFTWHALPGSYVDYTLEDGRIVHDIYTMIVVGFQEPIYSVVYILAMIGLGLHIKHGFHSMFQTLGFHGPELTPNLQKVSAALAILITLGFISIPISVLTGLVNLEPVTTTLLK